MTTYKQGYFYIDRQSDLKYTFAILLASNTLKRFWSLWIHRWLSTANSCPCQKCTLDQRVDPPLECCQMCDAKCRKGPDGKGKDSQREQNIQKAGDDAEAEGKAVMAHWNGESKGNGEEGGQLTEIADKRQQKQDGRSAPPVGGQLRFVELHKGSEGALNKRKSYPTWSWTRPQCLRPTTFGSVRTIPFRPAFWPPWMHQLPCPCIFRAPLAAGYSTNRAYRYDKPENVKNWTPKIGPFPTNHFHFSQIQCFTIHKCA